MTRILILSKNSLAEQNLQCSLQRLNEEVYCSFSLLTHIDSFLEIVKYFSVVILSDTIATLEMVNYLPHLFECDVKIIRKGDKEFIKNSEHSWMFDKIDAWIDEEMTITELTEIIAKFNALNNDLSRGKQPLQIEENNDYKLSHINFTQFITTLSKNERKVLFSIFDAKGSTVSRKELCQLIWETPQTNSALSQLSAIINRIKSKMVKGGFADAELQTVWGYGYRMGDIMYSYLKKNNFSLKM